MARRRTQHAGRGVGNEQPISVDGLTRISSVEVGRETVLDGVLIEDADLYGANLRSVRFERCDLCEVDFSQSTLETVDLRTSTLTEIRGISSLKGATIDGGQLIDLAPSFASELGIQIENLDSET